jgi:hypothetical protein
MIPYLIPLVSVGQFALGSSIKLYSKEFNFKIVKEEFDSFTSFHYSFDTNITLFVHDDLIDSISCDEECFYQGKNLIGISLEEFILTIGENYQGEPDVLDFEEDSDIPQVVYEFENLGLQVWTKNEIIVTIIAS